MTAPAAAARSFPPFLYGSVEHWYSQCEAKTVERRLEANQDGTLTWCPEWWRHPEAVSRLEALWRAWEVCRYQDGEAPARWWWQHHDPIFTVLSHPKRGPFADCKPTKHHAGDMVEFLPHTPAEPGWWGSEPAA